MVPLLNSIQFGHAELCVIKFSRGNRDSMIKTSPKIKQWILFFTRFANGYII